MKMKFRVLYYVALLLIASLLFQVSRCQSEDSESEEDADFLISRAFLVSALRRHRVWNTDVDANHTTEHFDFRRKLFGVDNVEPFIVDTLCTFPNNSDRSFDAGKEYDLLLDVKNKGKSELLMIAIYGNIYHPNDHVYPVQQLTAKGYIMQFVKPSSTRTFPYSFVVGKDLKVGKYDLVGTLLYVMDQTPCNTTFFKGNIEIVETRVTMVIRAITYITLGLSFLLFFLWRYRKLYQKWEDEKRAKKEQEEAEMRWLLEETGAANKSSSKKKMKSKKN